MRNIMLGLAVLFLFSCQQDNTEMLYGEWHAYQLLEEGEELPLDSAVVRFEFHESGVYKFHSTLNYEEAGYFHLKSDLLFTTDTLHENGQKKAVRVLFSAPDSLRMEMQEDDKERILNLHKVN